MGQVSQHSVATGKFISAPEATERKVTKDTDRRQTRASEGTKWPLLSNTLKTMTRVRAQPPARIRDKTSTIEEITRKKEQGTKGTKKKRVRDRQPRTLNRCNTC